MMWYHYLYWLAVCYGLGAVIGAGMANLKYNMPFMDVLSWPLLVISIVLAIAFLTEIRPCYGAA